MEVEENSEETSGLSKERRLRPERGTKRDRSPKGEISDQQLVRWTPQEVKDAITGLEKFGLTRIESITKMMPPRTTEQVKNWLWRIGREAYKVKTSEIKMDCGELVLNTEHAITVKLANCDRGRSHLSNNRQLSTISKSLLLISCLENHPVTDETQQIDFKKLYDALYMAMKGYPLPSMNTATLKFFCQSMRKLLKTASYYPILSFPSEDNEAVQNLAKIQALNPLSLECNLLKARIDLTSGKSYTDVPRTMKDWVSKRDWSLLK